MSRRRIVCAAAAAAVWMSAARALPTCSENAHCPTGFYCKPERLMCVECIRCETLKRSPPLESTSCVTSIRDCGSCITGLIQDNRTAACILVDGEELRLTPHQWMAVIVAMLLLAVFLCVLIVCVLRNFRKYRLFSVTRMSMHAPSGRNVVPATAPMPPPPYNNAMDVLQPTVDEGTSPLIKPLTPLRPVQAREYADRQAARVCSDPIYVQGPQLPSSFETTVLDEGSHEEDLSVTENSTNITFHNNADAAAPEGFHANETSELPAVAAKVHHTRQDFNNNSDNDDSEASFAGGCQSASFTNYSSLPLIINVIKNFNTVQQNNTSVDKVM